MLERVQVPTKQELRSRLTPQLNSYAPRTLEQKISKLRSFYRFCRVRKILRPFKVGTIELYCSFLVRRGGIAVNNNYFGQLLDLLITLEDISFKARHFHTLVYARKRIKLSQIKHAPKAAPLILIDALWDVKCSKADRAMAIFAVSSGLRAASIVGIRPEDLTIEIHEEDDQKGPRPFLAIFVRKDKILERAGRTIRIGCACAHGSPRTCVTHGVRARFPVAQHDLKNVMGLFGAKGHSGRVTLAYNFKLAIQNRLTNELFSPKQLNKFFGWGTPRNNQLSMWRYYTNRSQTVDPIHMFQIAPVVAGMLAGPKEVVSTYRWCHPQLNQLLEMVRLDQLSFALPASTALEIEDVF